MGNEYSIREPLIKELDFLLLESTEKMFNRFVKNTQHINRVETIYNHLEESRRRFSHLNSTLERIAYNVRAVGETLPRR
ncbi:hypothetical protein D3C80_2063270 [compost metagenome]